MYRLHPSWQAVTSGGIGEIGRLASSSPGSRTSTDDPTNIRNIREVGGGALFDIGCYSVNLVAPAVRRRAAARVGGAGARPGDGRGRADQRHPDLRRWIATFTCSTRAEDDQRVHIYGNDGTHLDRDSVQHPARRPTEVYVSAGGDPPVAPDTRVLTFEVADPYTVEAERFAAAVLDGRPAPVPPRTRSPTCA